MKHSNLYLGLVLPSGGWQSLIVQKHVYFWNFIAVTELQLKISYLFKIAIPIASDKYLLFARLWERHFNEWDFTFLIILRKK